jgi:xanthine dehydrogenase accessory factor
VREVTEALLALLQSGRDGALATVIRTTGSTPQVAGARLLIDAAGRRVGTVGGGALEQRVVEALLEVKRRGEPTLVALDLARDLGMCCGGSMQLFLEPIRATPRLIIFGAGHVALPTAALAASVGYEVVVVDERDELNTSERFPCCRRELSDVSSALRALEPSERDWLLIVTHDHQLDAEALRLALGSGARYIGLVGSRRKVYRLLERVVAREGAVDMRRIYAPVGLDLGAVTPAEIAVSIVAELIALRHQGGLGHLRAVDDARLKTLLIECARVSDETAGDPDRVDPESAAREQRPPRGAFDSSSVNGDDAP